MQSFHLHAEWYINIMNTQTTSTDIQDDTWDDSSDDDSEVRARCYQQWIKTTGQEFVAMWDRSSKQREADRVACRELRDSLVIDNSQRPPELLLYFHRPILFDLSRYSRGSTLRAHSVPPRSVGDVYHPPRRSVSNVLRCDAR